MSSPVAIITGATSGIGHACASVFANAGYRVILAGRRSDKGQQLADDLVGKGYTVAFKQTDVSDDTQLAELFAFADKTYGRVDVLFNNAGVEGQGTPLESKNAVDQYDFVYGINVRAIVASFQHAVPLLAKQGGVIINTSSVMSVLSGPMLAAYISSKSAVDSLSRVAAIELADKNIKVYTINPYVFKSEMSARGADLMTNSDLDAFARMFNPSGQVGKGSEVGEFLLELIEGKHDDKYQSGANIALDAGKVNFPVSEALAKAAAKQAEK
eukprot:TRINITY_DN3056_c0_g1_i1.p1 TRINITY_DN3056_c0_g1~~TRINITY_DN3056_c0_g1_i1.p1  ORF type:complete len:283 (+),score=78.88 TRINITY_DN3056_c0_g1_i1:40-849(+)